MIGKSYQPSVLGGRRLRDVMAIPKVKYIFLVWICSLASLACATNTSNITSSTSSFDAIGAFLNAVGMVINFLLSLPSMIQTALAFPFAYKVVAGIALIAFAFCMEGFARVAKYALLGCGLLLIILAFVVK